MEIFKLRNVITKMKTSPDGLNSRSVMAGRRVRRKQIKEKLTDPETYQKTIKNQYIHHSSHRRTERDKVAQEHIRGGVIV